MLHTLFLPILFLSYFGNTSNVEPIQPAQESPVLVELFTSQGCSSCPPADRVVADLVKDPTINIVALSFHVDYWNRLGWKDPYSQAAFSQRQYKYAEKLTNSRRVYTPQIVINGQSGHVGSRRQEVQANIQKAAQDKTPIDFKLDIDQIKGQILELNVDAVGVPNGYDLVVCLVDAKVRNEVPRGENRGRDLAHVQVVRSLEKVNASQTKSLELDLSVLDHPKSGKVVTFLQHQGSWKILGVQETSLKNFEPKMKP
ncbi:MAG: DUF1223 domain-containing protein [Bacteroidota bacterium]